MKRYVIIQTAPAVQTWTYEVTANSEDEAIALIESGEVECIDYAVDGDNFNGGDYIVEDEKDVDDDDDDFTDPAGGHGLYSHI